MLWVHKILCRAYPNKAINSYKWAVRVLPRGTKDRITAKTILIQRSSKNGCSQVHTWREHCNPTGKIGPTGVFCGLVVFQQALICRALLNFPLGSGLLDYTDSALTINTEPQPFVWRLRDPSRSQLTSLRSCPVCPMEHSELKRPRLREQWTEQ